MCWKRVLWELKAASMVDEVTILLKWLIAKSSSDALLQVAMGNVCYVIFVICTTAVEQRLMSCFNPFDGDFSCLPFLRVGRWRGLLGWILGFIAEQGCKDKWGQLPWRMRQLQGPLSLCVQAIHKWNTTINKDGLLWILTEFRRSHYGRCRH